MKGLFDLFRRRAEFGDLKEEIRAHLDEKIASLVAAGMPRAEAEQAARRAFGNITNVEQAGRDVWRMPRAEDLLSDEGFAFRFVRRSPAFSAVAVLSLALGIGANIAVFTVINALLLRPLPVNNPGALVVFSRQDAETGRTNSQRVSLRQACVGRHRCQPTGTCPGVHVVAPVTVAPRAA